MIAVDPKAAHKREGGAKAGMMTWRRKANALAASFTTGRDDAVVEVEGEEEEEVDDMDRDMATCRALDKRERDG